jgi:Mrp family chromosome partitioning ATPase
MGAGDLAILRDTRFADVLGDLRKQHPYVVVLAPSAASPDGVAVAAAAAYIVFSATAGHTKVRDLRVAVEQCEAVGSIVLGVVLFGVSGADARRA